MPRRSNVTTPDKVSATDDPGDETGRRYRYQWTYAAITCCALLDDTQDFKEIFCEHHEDVLVKHTDGTYTGLQIKTRASDQNVWKARDRGVIDSCARFARLELKFPGYFRAFRFLTNHPLHSGKNGHDLRYVLQAIKEAQSVSDLPDPVLSFVKKVATRASCTDDQATTALTKTDASDDLPKLNDVGVRLEWTLTSLWDLATECTTGVLRVAARALVTECEEASSLAHEDTLPAYVSALSDPVASELALRLKGKCIDKMRVLGALEQAVNQIMPLADHPDRLAEPGGGTTTLLEAKLDAGGFSAVSLNSAMNLRDKADYLGVSLIRKHGRPTGLQHYEHLRSLVLSDAATAFEQAKSGGDSFGPAMLSQLRERFQSRRDDGSLLYRCSNEHLEGISYSLTSECEIRWSIDSPWESES